MPSSAGLMEITYGSGARVILEGPALIKSNPMRGGYLSLGKLTARVEKGEEGRGKREENGERRDSEGWPLQRPVRSWRRPRSRKRSIPSPEPEPRTPKIPFILHPSSLILRRPHSHGRRHRPGHRVRRGSERAGKHDFARFPWIGRSPSGRRETPRHCVREGREGPLRATAPANPRESKRNQRPAACGSCRAARRALLRNSSATSSNPSDNSICWTSSPAATAGENCGNGASIPSPADTCKRPSKRDATATADIGRSTGAG